MRLIALVLSVSIFVTACAGRAANPVLLDQVGDNQKSCETLQVEMSGIQSQIQKLVPESDKTGKNVGLGIGGFFLLGIPWFFMDLSDAEKAEINAYNMRYNKLMTLSTQKKCQFLVVTPDTPEANNSVAPQSPTQSTASPARTAIMPKSSAINDLPNPAKRLESLNELLKNKLISQDEYDKKKTEILNSL